MLPSDSLIDQVESAYRRVAEAKGSGLLPSIQLIVYTASAETDEYWYVMAASETCKLSHKRGAVFRLETREGENYSLTSSVQIDTVEFDNLDAALAYWAMVEG